MEDGIDKKRRELNDAPDELLSCLGIIGGGATIGRQLRDMYEAAKPKIQNGGFGTVMIFGTGGEDTVEKIDFTNYKK